MLKFPLSFIIFPLPLQLFPPGFLCSGFTCRSSARPVRTADPPPWLSDNILVKQGTSLVRGQTTFTQERAKGEGLQKGPWAAADSLKQKHRWFQHPALPWRTAVRQKAKDSPTFEDMNEPLSQLSFWIACFLHQSSWFKHLAHPQKPDEKPSLPKVTIRKGGGGTIHVSWRLHRPRC